MFSSNLIISALALASSSYAASCTSKGTLTIENASDLTDLATCTTFKGSIALSTKYPGDVSIDGLREITGDFTTSSSKMTSLTASSLQKIGGTWTMETPSNIGSVSMPMLSQVKEINWANWPLGINSLDFTTGITEIDSITITGTKLNGLDGINPKSVNVLNLNSNQLLQNVTMQISAVKQTLSIVGNSAAPGSTSSVSVSFPKLKQAALLTFTQVGSIDLPALEKTSQPTTVRSSYLTSIDLPELQQSGGISISNNTMLKKISLPKLKTDNGALTVQANKVLGGTLSFPKLETVKGGPKIIGAFSGLSIPKLKQVQGHFTIASTKQINSVCNHFQSLGSGVIAGGVNCHGKLKKVPVPSNNGNNGGGGNGGSGGNGGNAAGHIQASLGLVLGGVATIATLLL